MTLYFVVNPLNHGKQVKYKYHDTLASATAEALRLSKLEHGVAFLVLEAKAIGKVQDGKMLEVGDDKV